ncbi:mitochondrial import inner membrane translocase subunit Tim21-like [Solea solea]|uniref:mitochondrial import inner membrane translocase subunit Tim21-like n=1 Tax=Solea solea TaxID=90069 RepID=UPI00272AC8CC|nr:mitochondrial import inner membrane translocase subunit Tim21-like [Solea solea]XP_058488367.1 mitochondrial import inner membrane translocase subunit Tim21-like [Solea solea]XP_058488375.1 mitochondrial import inner membrane translocase subunit Tim21-like [Solea solea]
MAYTQILRALHRSWNQSYKVTQVSLLINTHRTLSTVVSTPTLLRRVEAPASLLPTLSCFTLAHSHRNICVDFRLRNKSSPEHRDQSVSRYQGGSSTHSAARKVKDAGRDFTYLIVILIGLGVTGGLLYVVFQELFSSSSPNKVYGKAFNKVKANPEVIGAFGEPIKCYGETTRRGRRQQVSHVEYLKDGLKHMRLKFYIEGSEPGLKGIVHSESKEDNETGKYEFRYIFVEIDTYPRRSIIVEDNR